MNDEELLIDQFLAGTLSEEDAAAFSERIQSDEGLRNRVNLRRELTSYFGSEEFVLTELLEKVGEEKDSSSENRPKRKFWRWFLLGILLLVLSLWQLTADPGADQPEEISPVNDSVSMPDAMGEAQTFSPIDSQEVSPPPASAPSTNPAPARAPQLPERTIPQPPSPAPLPEPEEDLDTLVYASLNPADFTPNPLLEDLVQGVLRSTDSTSITFNYEGDTLRFNQANPFRIDGFSTAAPPFELVVFDNDEDRFLADQSVIKTTVRTEELLNGYRFSLPLDAIKQPGRYYFLLLGQNDELLTAKRILLR